jgi:hypothetical protein
MSMSSTLASEAGSEFSSPTSELSESLQGLGTYRHGRTPVRTNVHKSLILVRTEVGTACFPAQGVSLAATKVWPIPTSNCFACLSGVAMNWNAGSAVHFPATRENWDALGVRPAGSKCAVEKLRRRS